ncbi:MAG: hypothetical protein K6E95_08710 [Lachnospiraceae bacterium]|nr:hypothetical protein [Lachnospiraceae bacterium]
MKTTHCSNLLKYILMVFSFLLIFACIFPFYEVDNEELTARYGEETTTAIITELNTHVDPADSASDLYFNGKVGVLNYITGSTGKVVSGTLAFYSYVMLFIPILMFVVFFLWRWIPDSITGIIVAILSLIEFIFSLLFGSAAASAFSEGFPNLAQYDVFDSHIMLIITIVASIVIFLLSVFLALWDKIFAVKGDVKETA